MRVTKLTADGLAPAETTWTYGANLRMTSSRLVSGADDVTLAYTRDADGLPTAVGPFTHERNGPDHSLSAITDGTGRTEEDVDDLADLDTRRLTVGGAEKYRLELTTDATGRVTGRREVDPEGGDHSYAYTHNALGELTEVRRDGTLVESYAYDVDGDRTSQGATYDAAGRLTSRNGIELHVRRRRLPRRRAARTRSPTPAAASCARPRSAAPRSPTPTTGWGAWSRGSRAATPRATSTAIPTRRTGCRRRARPTARSIATSTGRAATSTRSCAAPRASTSATDQVGSPRVVAAADGTVVKRLEYTAYGVTTDHDPGVLPPVRLRRRSPRSGDRRSCASGCATTSRSPAASPRATPRCSKAPRDRSTATRTTRPSPTTTPAAPASSEHRRLRRRRRRRHLLLRPEARSSTSDKPLITGLCVEAGIGVGGGIEADFLEQAPTQAGLNAFAELNGVVPCACGQDRRRVRPDLRDRQVQVGRATSAAAVRRQGGDTTTPRSATPSSRARTWATSITDAACRRSKARRASRYCLPPPPR